MDGPQVQSRGPGHRPLLEASDVMRYSSGLDEVGMASHFGLPGLRFHWFLAAQRGRFPQLFWWSWTSLSSLAAS